MSRRKRRHRVAVLSLLLPCALLGLGCWGCSGSPPAPVPPVKERAVARNRQGLSAEARGDRDGALAAFGESLKLHRSVEDDSGAAVALVNLARVHRLRGEIPLAKEKIDAADPLLPPGTPLFPEMAFEKAMIALASGDLPAAKEWATRAVDTEKGAASGRMLNLLARVLLLEGRSDEAQGRAESALAANRNAGARGEEANSLRLLGDIATARKDRERAGELYAASLSIDKGIANSRKIAADLRALGALAAGEEDTGKALGFYTRAYDVSVNGDDSLGAASALLEMARLYEKAGAPEKAQSARTKRELLLGGRLTD